MLTNPDVFMSIWANLSLPVIADMLHELDPRPRGERYLVLLCPGCNHKEGYLYTPKGKGPHIHCNRKNNCGYDKTLYDYLKQREGDSKKVLEMLASAANVSLDGPMPTRQERDKAVTAARFSVPPLASPTVINEEAIPADIEERQSTFRNALAGSPGEDYLRTRGVFFSEDDAYRSGLGYCRQWKGFPRLTYPVVDRSGRMVAIAGRYIGNEPKVKRYLVYGAGNGVYVPFRGAFCPDHVVFVEGVFDALALSLIGVNAVAVQGTNFPEWLQRACAFRSEILQIATDADKGGDDAAAIWSEVLARKGTATRRVRPLNDGWDWADYLRDGGVAAVGDAFRSAGGLYIATCEQHPDPDTVPTIPADPASTSPPFAPLVVPVPATIHPTRDPITTTYADLIEAAHRFELPRYPADSSEEIRLSPSATTQDLNRVVLAALDRNDRRLLADCAAAWERYQKLE